MCKFLYFATIKFFLFIFQMNASSALRLLLLCTIGVTFAWVNDYDEPFLFECPVGRPIYWFQSDHDDYYDDKIFDFQVNFLLK